MLEEAWAQGDREKDLGLPVQKLNDRLVSVPDSQLGFVHLLIAPFMVYQLKVFDVLQERAEHLMTNAQKWGEMLKAERQADTEDERVEAISSMLRKARIPKWQFEPPAAGNPVRRVSSLAPSCVHPPPPLATISTAEGCTLRELCRWQESHGVPTHLQRELVLLYAVSEVSDSAPEAARGQTLHLRGAAGASLPVAPETAAAGSGECPGGLLVQKALDSKCT